MLFQVDIPTVIRDLDIMLWTVANSFTFINMIITFRRFLNKDLDKPQRTGNLAWSLYFLFMLLANILSIAWRRFILEMYGENLAKLLENLSMIFLNCGWLVLVGYFDLKRGEKKKPIFFIIMLVIFPITILINFHSGTIIEVIYVIATIIGFSIVPIMFIQIAKYARGIIRKNSLRIAAALITFGIGLIIQQQNVEPFFPQIIDFFDNTLGFPYVLLSPIVLGVSMIIFWLGIFQIYGYIEE
ncbi:MAG: hypothetical protein ACTSRZ_01315 [Promethearchaeota archaeon]